MILRSYVIISIAGFAAAASAFSQPRSSRQAQAQTALAASYLESLGGASAGDSPKPASYGISGSSFRVVPEPFANSHTPEPRAVESSRTEAEEAASEFPYAPASFFGMDKLVSKGPRPTADWGTPGDATCKLCDDGTFRAGAWYCSEGGWPSPNGKAATEVFYVLEGYGSLDDADGARHYFGPGDNVIIPKGHTGRWDVNGPIRKVWAVNAHENIEETSNPIRVRVDHYNSWAPRFLTRNEDGSDPLYGDVSEATAVSSSTTFYDVGPTKVGVWSSEPGSYTVSRGRRAWIHVLEGVAFVTNGADGSSRRCEAGDTVVLPAGWHGHVDVVEATKQLWTVAE